jgi:hypothetical protein
MTPWVEDDDPRTFDKCRDCKGTSWVLYRCERGEQVSLRDPKLPRKVATLLPGRLHWPLTPRHPGPSRHHPVVRQRGCWPMAVSIRVIC